MKNVSAIRMMMFESKGSFETKRMGEAYQKALGELIERENAFLQDLKENGSLKESYEKLSDAVDEVSFQECVARYEEGFRFGVLLGLDIAGIIKEE